MFFDDRLSQFICLFSSKTCRAVRIISTFAWLTLLVVAPLSGQFHKIDSLKALLSKSEINSQRIELLIDLSGELRKACRYTEAHQLIDNVIQRSKEHNNLFALQQAYLEKVMILRTAKFYHRDSSLYYLRQSKSLAEKLNSKKGVISCITQLGIHYLYYHTDQIDSALYYLNKADELHEPIVNTEDKCRALCCLSRYYNVHGNNDMALKYAHRAEQIHDDNYHAYHQLGVVYTDYTDLGQFTRGIDYLLKTLEITSQNNDVNMFSSANNNLGVAYYSHENYEKALEYFLIAYKKDSTNGNYPYLINSIGNVGLVFNELGQHEEAITYFRRSLAYARMTKIHCSKYMPTQGLGVAYYALNQYDSANYYLQLSLSISEKCDEIEMASKTLITLGKMEQDRGDLERSQQYFTKAFNISYQVGKLRTRQFAAEGLYAIYKELGNFKKALHYHEIYKANQDSLFNRETTASISRMEAKHEFNQEKQELIAQQEREELILQNEIKRQKLFRYSAIGGGLLFLVLFINFYLSFRRKKKANQLIRTQHEQLEELSYFKEGLTNMIAHDMKNLLNTIIGFSSSEPSDKKMNSINHAGQVLLNLVTNMLDVQRFEEAEVSLELKSNRVCDIVEEARRQVALLFQMKSQRLEIHFHDNLTIDVDGQIMVRVLVNLLNNAVKYSKPGRLVTLTVDRIIEHGMSTCRISIADQGQGIHDSQLPHIFEKFWKDSSNAYGYVASTGLGLTFCKLAIEAHHGVISVESEQNKGTTFYLTLPCRVHELAEGDQRGIVMVDEDVLILDHEKELLVALSDKLNQLEVYQVGELNALLFELEEQNIKSRWKQNLVTAVYQSNEEEYKRLIKLIVE